jgi:acyl-CoA synthetase (AMP-forming)/AMP-acid ligase II
MRGYLNPEANAKFQALGGWYDTGDIVRIDPDGFLFILGRLKRFAKVSGEMVSLAAVEDALAGAFPQYGLRFAVAVVARPDATRGEKLIAVTNEPRLTMEEVRAAIHARGLSNLAAPREIKPIHEIHETHEKTLTSQGSLLFRVTLLLAPPPTNHPGATLRPPFVYFVVTAPSPCAARAG